MKRDGPDRPDRRRPRRLLQSETGLLLIGLIALVSSALLAWSNELWWKSYAAYVPAADSIRQARHAATRAYLLQGRLSAGEAVDAQEIAAHLDRAMLASRDALDGRSNLTGVPAAEPGGELRAELYEYRTALEEFDRIGRRIVAGRDDERGGLRILQINAFNKAEQQADHAEAELALLLRQNVERQQWNLRLGFGLWLGFLIVMFALMLRLMRLESRFARQRRLTGAIVHRSTDAIFVKDLAGRYELFNPAASRLVGRPAEDALGRTDAELFPPETAALAQRSDRAALDSGEFVNLEYDLARPDSGTRTLWTTKGPLFDEQGRIVGVFGISRDITERRRLEAELQAHREHLEDIVTRRTAELAAAEASQRLILESAGDGLFGVDTEGTATFVNPAACRMLGYEAGALVGRRIHPAIHHSYPDGRPLAEAECATWRTLREGRALTVDDQVFWRADGQPLAVSFTTHPMLREGAIVGAVVSFTDVSVRRRTEQRLRRFAQFVEQIAGVRDQRGLMAILHEAARELAGADGAALVLGDGGRALRAVADDTDPARAAQRMPLDLCVLGIALRESGAIVIEDIRSDPRLPPELFRPDSIRSICALPIGKPFPFGAIGFHWARGHAPDVEEMSLQHALADAAAVGLANLDLYAKLESSRIEAERLSQVKSAFLANMSHEIRTPLNGVLGMAQIGYRDAADAHQQETFGRILEAGKVLLGVINDILDFSKIDAGKLSVEQVPVDLDAVIEQIRSDFSVRARNKGLAFEIERSADLPRFIVSDPVRLQQILANLLANAVKFTARGRVELAIAREANWLRLRVRDTGIGMAAEQVARLFRPFEQADASTTRRFGGTGLGLAITHNLVGLLGGDVRVDSREGEGSCFEVRLPLAEAGPAPQVPAHVPTRGDRLRGLRVLAIDDVELNRLVLEDLLVGEGATVTLAGNGREAVAAVRAAAFDVVLMDVQMPGMDGFEATRLIKAIAPDLPVVGQTAHAMDEERQRCIDAGMADHIAKPFDLEQVVGVIRRCVRDGPGRRGVADASSPAG